MPAKQTTTTLPENPTIGERPVILSISNPYPGDPTRVIRPKKGLGVPPSNMTESFPTTNVALPTSGMGAPPGVLQAPTPIPGRQPTKVHVPKQKDKSKKDDQDTNKKDDKQKGK